MSFFIGSIFFTFVLIIYDMHGPFFIPDDGRDGMDNFILFLMIRFLGYNYMFEYSLAGPIPLRKVCFKIRDVILLDDLPELTSIFYPAISNSVA